MVSKREHCHVSVQVCGTMDKGSVRCSRAALASKYMWFRSAPRSALSSSSPAVIHCLSLSAACFASPIHFLHASLILINMWISATRGWGDWAGRRSSRDAGASSALLLLAPMGLPGHQLCPMALPGPCCSPGTRQSWQLWTGWDRNDGPSGLLPELHPS